jgi:hypothetical protein
MGIWIRSQDKALYNCIGINAPAYRDYAIDKNKPWVVIGVVATEYEPWLGWYSTEERALQVLDEIQEFITAGTRESHEQANGCGWVTVEKYGCVYEMPAE